MLTDTFCYMKVHEHDSNLQVNRKRFELSEVPVIESEIIYKLASWCNFYRVSGKFDLSGVNCTYQVSLSLKFSTMLFSTHNVSLTAFFSEMPVVFIMTFNVTKQKNRNKIPSAPSNSLKWWLIHWNCACLHVACHGCLFALFVFPLFKAKLPGWVVQYRISENFEPKSFFSLYGNVFCLYCLAFWIWIIRNNSNIFIHEKFILR